MISRLFLKKFLNHSNHETSSGGTHPLHEFLIMVPTMVYRRISSACLALPFFISSLAVLSLLMKIVLSLSENHLPSNRLMNFLRKYSTFASGSFHFGMLFPTSFQNDCMDWISSLSFPENHPSEYLITSLTTLWLLVKTDQVSDPGLYLTV